MNLHTSGCICCPIPYQVASETGDLMCCWKRQGMRCCSHEEQASFLLVMRSQKDHSFACVILLQSLGAQMQAFPLKKLHELHLTMNLTALVH